MVEIDNLQRVTLRGLKPFFSHVKKLRKGVEEAIQKNPDSEAEALRLFSKGVSQIKGSFTLNDGRIVDIIPHVNTEAMEIFSFFFQWMGRDGNRKTISVAVQKRPSNLGIDEVYYFVCPHSGRLCRKLYTDGYTFTSRWAFTHTYSKRNQSKHDRELMAAFDAMMDVDSNHRYRKERYRGELTPFGKRMVRNFNNIARFVGDFTDSKEFQTARADFESLALLAPRRGRPPKRW